MSAIEIYVLVTNGLSIEDTAVRAARALGTQAERASNGHYYLGETAGGGAMLWLGPGWPRRPERGEFVAAGWDHVLVVTDKLKTLRDEQELAPVAGQVFDVLASATPWALAVYLGLEDELERRRDQLAPAP